MRQKRRPLQRILVTGGAGFIGSHTVDLLLAQGKEVVVLDNLSSGKLTNLNLQHPDLEFIEGDVLEYPFLAELVAGCDAVLHLAAIVSVPISIENPIFTFQVNTQGGLHVLEAARHAPHLVRVVLASSAAVYGDAKELPCRDDVPLSTIPLSPYALQKLHVENYASLYAASYGVNSLALRYFNVYGSRQDPHSPYAGVISRFLQAYQANTTLTVFGDGLQSRDYIHVSDVARANLLALQCDDSGALNIATGQPSTLLELISTIQGAGDKPASIEHQPVRNGDILASYAAVVKAKTQIGFDSAISLKDGIGSLMQELAAT